MEETEARLDWPEIFKYPEAKRLVLETDARFDCPEMARLAPCKNPDAVRLVEETEAKMD